MTQSNNYESNNTNTDPGQMIGIFGFVLAFVGFSPVGLALSIVGYKKSKSVGIKNGLALAGIWVNAIFLALTVLIVAAVFSMTFLALPALQTSQRDTQRKNDTGQVITAITNYASSNRGQLPTDSNINDGFFVSSYITTGYGTWNSPSGEEYLIKTSGEPDTNVFILTRGETCEGITGDRKASVKIMLESGDEYCQSY